MTLPATLDAIRISSVSVSGSPVPAGGAEGGADGGGHAAVGRYSSIEWARSSGVVTTSDSGAPVVAQRAADGHRVRGHQAFSQSLTRSGPLRSPVSRA